MSMFVECESYKHKYSKNVVREWMDTFRGEIQYETFCGENISCRTNRPSGVWVEYPITIYDEIYDHVYTDSIRRSWDDPDGYLNQENIPPPTYEESIKYGKTIYSTFHKVLIFTSFRVTST